MPPETLRWKHYFRKASIEYFEQLASQLPLGIFVFVGTFLEEVISPIPSILVLLPAGAIVRMQDLSLWVIPGLALLCGAGRVAGGSILYWAAHYLERALLSDRRVLGLTHRDIVRFSRRLGDPEKSGRVWAILFALHALPVFPGTVLSAGAGFIKVPFITFVTATLFGSMVNALVYLWIGYLGSQAAEYLNQLGWLTNIVTVLLVILVVWWLIKRQRRRANTKSPQ